MYHYTESGLRNVWLSNGYRIEKTAYGKGVVFENIPSLHRAIGKHIVTTSPRLTGPEVRFLRSEMELSQAALAGLFGNDAQTVALWEKGKVKVPKWADRLLRAFYREHVGENVKIRALAERAILLENEPKPPTRIEAARAKNGWQLKQAA